MLDHLIETVTAAQLALDESAAAHAEHCEEAQRLLGRIEKCRARQSEITRRRIAGEVHPQETAEYAALDGDVTMLNELHAEAKAKADATRPEQTRAALARAKGELEEYQQEAAFLRVVEHARAAEQVYLQCLYAVEHAAKERGGFRTFGEAFQIDSTIRNLCRWNAFTGLELRK